MTSNIETIRAAEAQIPLLQDQLQALRQEALADDGIVDAEERVEIERVEGKIDALKRAVAERLQIWQANKTAYEQLRSKLAPGLDEIARCDKDALSRDRQAVSDAAAEVDQTAAAEDYATALGLARALEKHVADFRELVAQLQENERLAALTPEELAETSLTSDGLDEVFTEEYMRELMVIEFPSERDPQSKADLKALMIEIEAGLSNSRRGTAMEELAVIVGEPPSAAELDADYARFLILLKQQEAVGTNNKSGEVPDLDETKHPDFRASREQLLFGKVMGDVFGIHEVFAALLSPTGGLVGPGNELIPGLVDSPHLSPDNPVALHGTVHDAAGYLKAYHNEGPGYNYRGNDVEAIVTDVIELLPDDIANTILPLTGQISGIAYWTWEAGDEYLEARCDEAVVLLEKELSDARDQAAVEIAEVIADVERTKQEVSDAAERFADDVEDRLDEAEQDLRDAADAFEAEVLDVADAFEDAVDRASSAAVEAYEEASAGARAMSDAAMEKLDAVASFIWS